MWDERYAEEGYAFGTEPNGFLEESVIHIPHGPVLSLCEGEGRNAVFLARMGFEVTGIDSSAIGLAKARLLAESRRVPINLVQADVTSYAIEPERYGAVVAIFAHLTPAVRREVHRRAVGSLMRGGVVIVESYTPRQLGRGTGGPREEERLVTLEELKEDFNTCSFLIAREVERDVIEGRYHTGMASVVQLVAKKIEDN